jgi:hypothetical protein
MDVLDPVTVTNLPAPVLNISSAGTNLMVSWPAYASNFSLQETMDFTNPTWTDAQYLEVPSQTNGQIQVILSPANSSNSFFRLSRQ